ncbi:MAG: YbjN domain-containing protein, partial [Proteobacteria bacterium]|nr:YbjN domain-containing protein [Pseudomonadota bacterium]
KFGVFFYNCQSDWTGCTRYQYIMYYTRVNNVPFEQVNNFNDRWIYGKLSRRSDDQRKLTLFFADYLVGGVTRDSIDRTFRLWGGVVRSFFEHFSLQSHPGQLMSSAVGGQEGPQIAAAGASNEESFWTVEFSEDEDARSKILNNFGWTEE